MSGDDHFIKPDNDVPGTDIAHALRKLYRNAPLIEQAAAEIDRQHTNVRHWREECGKLHAQIAGLKYKVDLQNDQVTISLDHYSSLLRSHQKLSAIPGVGECTDEMAHAMSRLDGYDRDRGMPTLGRWKDYWDAAMIEVTKSPIFYDPATQPFDEPLRHVDVGPHVCKDCPPAGYPTNATRCADCPRLSWEECGNISAGSPPR